MATDSPGSRPSCLSPIRLAHSSPDPQSVLLKRSQTDRRGHAAHHRIRAIEDACCEAQSGAQIGMDGHCATGAY
jgi:hypothetical protein